MRSHNPRHYLLYMNVALFLILLLEAGFYLFIFPKSGRYKNRAGE